MRKRLALTAVALLLACGAGAYFFNRYWIHRYDALIARHAALYGVDPDLVWSIIHEETYFSPWKVGDDGEIGLMQVTPAVAREWAAEPGTRVVAAYNAGPRRAQEWNQTEPGQPPLTTEQFIQRIDIPSTRAYVS